MARARRRKRRIRTRRTSASSRRGSGDRRTGTACPGPDASHVRSGQYCPPAMRLVVARCEVPYPGRLPARLPEAVRLLVFKPDGSFLVHDDAGGFRPLNWMTPPTVVEETAARLVVRKPAGKTEDRLEARPAA